MTKFLQILAVLLLVPVLLSAQTVVNVPSDLPPQEGNLNNAVQAAKDGGTLSSTEFHLEPYGYYVLTGTISVPAGQTLTIVAPEPGNTQESAPPQIVWTSSGGVDQQYNFEVFGNIVLKNIWIRYANTSGNQVGSALHFSNDPLAVNGQSGTFEGVIFDFAPSPPNASGAVSIGCEKFNGTFKNCYFKNCVDAHLRYYGRALSFPYQTTEWHTENVLFENCTFANLGYVYMQEGTEYGDNVKFNHCTFLNVVMFPLQSGWWNKLAVTNSLFVNCWMFGNNPAQTGTGDPNGGTFRIDSVATFNFTVPFSDQDRRILFANSAYYVDQWLTDWMFNNPNSVMLRQQRRGDEVPVAQPMLSPNTLVFFDSVAGGGGKLFPYMNRANLHDGVNPEFVLPPTDNDLIKAFMLRKWSDNTDTLWAWKPNNDFIGLWPLEEDLSYTNTTLKSGGMGGFPVGDLYNWWPTEYAQWKAQADAENQRITQWQETGIDPLNPVSVEQYGADLPFDYSLSQNYPNPFNPTTQIRYSVPQEGYVSLKVFNALGQEMATLFSGTQQAGNYVATFDAKGLSSGIYFYRLQSGTVSITKKFALMK